MRAYKDNGALKRHSHFGWIRRCDRDRVLEPDKGNEYPRCEIASTDKNEGRIAVLCPLIESPDDVRADEATGMSDGIDEAEAGRGR